MNHLDGPHRYGGGDDGREQLPSMFQQAAQESELKDEVKSLRAALGKEQRKMLDGFFGPSTPSSKKHFKNSIEENDRTKKCPGYAAGQTEEDLLQSTQERLS